jgi:hypothetical protein
MDLIHVREPGMSIFHIPDTPGEGPIDHKIHASAHGHCKSILLVLYRPIAALRIVWKRPASIIPGVYQFFLLLDIVDFMRDSSAPDKQLRIW